MNVIEAVDLTKKYGEFVANDRINITVAQGEITAIVGENGAGKTTLMNMFYGLLPSTSGQLFVKGQQVAFNSPLDAINLGLGMVHQHFKLVPSLTVFENIVLGTETNKALHLSSKRKLNSPIIDLRREQQAVQELIQRHKFDLSATDIVRNLSVGAQQRVEILKMLYRNVDILIFDEPTSALAPQEVDELLINFRELQKDGKTIIFITHKLREVMEVSDKVVVIKRGKVAGSAPTVETSPEELARMMVGRDVIFNVNESSKGVTSKDKPIAYQVRNLSSEIRPGKKFPQNINFEIREGEILGIAGVEGNGQSELVKVLSGLMESVEGSVHLYDKEITNHWPDELRAAGIGIIPEDRYAQGLCREMSLEDNLICGQHGNKAFCSYGILQRSKIHKHRDTLIDEYDVRIAEKEGQVSQLSGGNAQKIIIAREFDSDPKVLIACQPTRGVDIGSIEFIHSKLLELKRRNKAILLVSSELSEVMSLSDRILVMYKGEVVGEVNGDAADTAEIGLLMTGITNNLRTGGDGA